MNLTFMWQKARQNQPWQKCPRNRRNTHTRTNSQKKSVHLQQSPCRFLDCVLVCIVIPLTLTFSAFQRSHFSDIHVFFFPFSRWLKYSLLSFVLLSQYLSVYSLSSFTILLLPLALSLSLSLSRFLAPPPHCLSLSLHLSLSPLSLLLCSGCWHASSAWQSQDCYFIYLVFFSSYFLSVVSL